MQHLLKQVKNWVKELRKMLGSDIALCIAGNKTDLEKDRHVDVAEAEAYVDDNFFCGGGGANVPF